MNQDTTKCAENNHNKVIFATLKYNENIIKQFYHSVVSSDNTAYVQSLLNTSQLVCKYSDFDENLPFQHLLKRRSDFSSSDPDLVSIFYRLQDSVGCSHISCGCELFCADCQQFFGCRKCHDADQSHPANFTQLRCRYCSHSGQISNSCSNCNILFATYFCHSCNVFDDFSFYSRPIHHSTVTNKCVCSAASNDACMICFGNLSDHEYTQLECGHKLHCVCKFEAIRNNVTLCPTCKVKITVQSEDVPKKLIQRVVYNQNWAKTLYKCVCGVVTRQYKFPLVQCVCGQTDLVEVESSEHIIEVEQKSRTTDQLILEIQTRFKQKIEMHENWSEEKKFDVALWVLQLLEKGDYVYKQEDFGV
ncbi:CHY_zinc finger domain-containing protein [Hexamita inflata]|uniref:CHY zinc finger domain-containing protein n=1 Tax=Hexamita inflata TaxID=28002 RepID=A0AA86ULY5_9EUKA|nr:CHY zinc finger domain-containing protein [Hexamita inflata]